uniref:Bestrophin homolog n=1 Tax=Romanomermis culicivorax TaxID=13658 RepID=A0A915HWN0_ROMCU
MVKKILLLIFPIAETSADSISSLSLLKNMTVTYTSEVATQRIGGFFRFLFRWRGSIYSVIYGEISIFMVLYAILSITYRHLLNDNQKLVFERLCVYFNQFSDYVPVTFVVGFYVARIIARRWTQWENIPWPDKYCFKM